jgi:hypothetical protein
MSQPNLMRVVAVLTRAPGLPAGDTDQCLDMLVCLTPDAQMDSAQPVPAEYWRARRLRAGQKTWAGQLIRTGQGWALRSDRGEDEPLWHVDAGRLRPGDHLTLRRPDGEELAFRVVNVGPPAP